MGKVWLVGAGPGDGGLFTICGMQVLRQAQVVVYDALVGAEVLSWIPQEAEKIYVGKRAGCHAVKQEEINHVLVKYAKAGKRVVRLKGGDPFLFGRGGEEAEALYEAGIPFEIVPGVPSAFAVPAYNGIPVTHRDSSSSVHILTAHKKADLPLHLDFDALCRLGGTLVFLMGAAALSEICNGLLAAGMPPKTPAALLSQGTTPIQKRIIATLDTLDQEEKQQCLPAPAVIVVGEVCALADKFQWFYKKPLASYKIWLTGPQGRYLDLQEKLKAYGAQVLALPAIQLVLQEDSEAFPRIKDFSWIAFTSPSAIELFFELCKKKRIDIRTFCNLQFAVLGKGTAAKLEEYGFYADLMPERADGASLGRLLAERLKAGESILLPRARKGYPAILEELKKNTGIAVTEFPLYDTEFVTWKGIDFTKELEPVSSVAVVFTSPLTVKGFIEQIHEIPKNKLKELKAVCIGRAVMKTALEYGIQAYQADTASQDGIFNKIMEIAAQTGEHT